MQLTFLRMAANLIKVKNVQILKAKLDLKYGTYKTIDFVQKNLKALPGLAFPVCSAAVSKLDGYIQFTVSPYTFDDKLSWVVPVAPPKAYWENVLTIFQPQLWFICIVLCFIVTSIYWLAFRRSFNTSWLKIFMFVYHTNLGTSLLLTLK